MNAPEVVAVSNAVKELVRPTTSAGQTNNRELIVISLDQDQTEPVFIAFGTRSVTTSNGMPLYPGERLTFQASSEGRSVGDQGIFAIAATGPVNVRVQA